MGECRRHNDCEFDAATGTSNTGWEIYRMPIQAQYCDAWYEACKNDYYCYEASTGDNSWFKHSSVHAKGLCTAASGNCKTFADIFGATPWLACLVTATASHAHKAASAESLPIDVPVHAHA